MKYATGINFCSCPWHFALFLINLTKSINLLGVVFILRVFTLIKAQLKEKSY